jgi:hypothetical protein
LRQKQQGRYPMHFHLLGDSCRDCYVKDSSFYRCISIHGTNGITVSENVAYDVTGYCYYLEDGVEEENTLSFNLAAFIHAIGPETPSGNAQTTNVYQQNDQLTLPADVTAAGFYITNVHNNLIGNTASGVSSAVKYHQRYIVSHHHLACRAGPGLRFRICRRLYRLIVQ